MDGLIDFRGQAWVIMELKLIGTPLPDGQRLAFDRLYKDLKQAGRCVLYLIAEHDIIDPNESIYVASVKVIEYQTNVRMKLQSRTYTVRELIEHFLTTAQWDTEALWTVFSQ